MQGNKDNFDACFKLVSLAAVFWMSRNALGDTQITAARETSFKLAFCRKSIRCRQLLYSTAKDVSLPNLSINSSVYY